MAGRSASPVLRVLLAATVICGVAAVGAYALRGEDPPAQSGSNRGAAGSRGEPAAAPETETDGGGSGTGPTSSATEQTQIGPTTSAAPTTAAGPPADQRQLFPAHTIRGGLTPKSIVWDHRSEMWAQNMIYSHTVNVYGRDFQRTAQVSDEVDLTALGRPGKFKGGPVEAAVSADGAHMYVTNYQMYGPGFAKPGQDKCAPAGYDPSFVYRVGLDSKQIDQIIQVGSVPKFIATSPDGKWVLNANWCDYDLSVIDAAQGKEVRRVKLGPYPRGIVVTPDSKRAYVAVMGSSDIAVVSLTDFSVQWIRGVGRGPRHIVISPDGKFVYATLNSAGQVVKIDTATNQVVGRVASAQEPRSMTISTDGTALYVVNYASDALSKIRTSDMTQTQRLPTDHHPIGIAYDGGTGRVWVACYSGSIMVFDDRATG